MCVHIYMYIYIYIYIYLCHSLPQGSRSFGGSAREKVKQMRFIGGPLDDMEVYLDDRGQLELYLEVYWRFIGGKTDEVLWRICKGKGKTTGGLQSWPDEVYSFLVQKGLCIYIYIYIEREREIYKFAYT